MKTVTDFLFLGSLQTSDHSHEIKRRLLFGRKAMTNLDSILKSRDVTLLTKVCIVKAMLFSVVMYGCESWTVKKPECWRVDAFKLWFLGKTFESHLGTKEIKSINPKGNQPWILIGKTDTEAEALIHWPPDGKKKLTRKDPAAGKDWGQEEKRVTEDKMIR